MAPALRTCTATRAKRPDRHIDRILDAYLQFEPSNGRGPIAATTVSLRMPGSRGPRATRPKGT